MSQGGTSEERGRGAYRAGARVTQQATVAATVRALRRGVRVAEVAVPAALDARARKTGCEHRAEDGPAGRKRTQMRPAFQLSGTEKLTEVYALACHLSRGVSRRIADGNGEGYGPGSEVGLSATDVEVGEHL